MKFDLPSEAHGEGEGLRVVDLDVVAERRQEALGEELDLLPLGQGAGVGKQCLESALVLGDAAGALARREFAERIGAHRRPEPQVQRLGEAAP